MAAGVKTFLVLGTAAALAALAALAAFPARLAETGALLALKANGFPEASLAIVEIGWTRAVVENLSLGASGPGAGRIEATYALRDLIGRHHLESLSVSGLDLAIRGGPEAGYAVAGLPTPAPSDEAGPAATLGSLVLDGASVRFDVFPAPLPPLAVTGQATMAPDGAWTFQARARALDGRLTLDAAGRHGNGEGNADLHLYQVHFAPGKLQPADVSPAYASGLPEMAGKIEASGPISWNDKGLRGNVKVNVEDGSLKLEGLPVEGITGGLTLSSLKSIRLNELRARVAGGRLALADFPLLAPSPGPRKGRLTVEGVDAQALLDAFQVPDLVVRGRLRGDVPFTLDGERLSIAAGRLETDGPGYLRYTPATPPDALRAGGQGASLMLSALRNFSFNELRLTADREAEGLWQARIRLAGANPELMNGRPFEFNINIDGALDAILRQGLEGWRLPQTLADAITHRERK
jgi:hypothetical protein